MKRYWLLLIITISLFCTIKPPTTIAQTERPLADYPVITAENVAGLQQVRVFGEGYINDVIFSPDEQFVAMATTVGIWLYSVDDLETPIHLFGDYAINVTYAMFSPDGSQLFGGTSTGAVYIWDFETGEQIAQLSTPDETWRVHELRFSNDGKILFSYSFYHITLWNLEDFSLIKSLEVNPINGDYSTWIISPNEKYLVIYNVYNDVNLEATFSRTDVMNLSNGDTYRIENDDISLITPPHFSHNDEKLLAFNLVGHIGMWDALSGEFLKMVNNPLWGLGYYDKDNSVFAKQSNQDSDFYPRDLPISRTFTKIILTEDESKLILLDHHGTIIFDTQNTETLHHFSYNYDVRGDDDMVISELEIHQSVDETELMNLIEEYNLLDLIQMRYHLSPELYKRIGSWDGWDYRGSPISISPQKNYAFSLWRETCANRFSSCSYSTPSVYSIHIWNFNSGELIFSQDIYERCQNGNVLSLNNTRLVAYGGDTVCVWDIENQRVLYQVSTVYAVYYDVAVHERYFFALRRLGDDEWSDIALQIWDLQTDTFIEIPTEHRIVPYNRRGIDIAVFNYDNPHAITVGGRAYLWDLDTGTIQRNFNDGEHWVSDAIHAIISPNNEFVAFLTFDPTIDTNLVLITKTQDTRFGYILNGIYETATNNLIFSPDSQHILTTSGGKIKLWNSETGDLIYEVEDSNGQHIAINRDGSYFVNSGYNLLNQHDFASGELMLSYDITTIQDINNEYPFINSLEFSPVNNLLAVSISSGNRKGYIQIWDMDTQTILYTILLKISGSAKFNDEGNLIVVKTSDGATRIFGVPEG
jgi:WD40 repeat protein